MTAILWHYVKGHFKVFGQFYIILVLGWVTMAIYGYYNNMKYELKICNANLQMQNDAIEDLKIKSLAAKKRAEEAAKQAAISHEESNKAVAAILNSKITDDCMGAIRWGINQSKEF